MRPSRFSIFAVLFAAVATRELPAAENAAIVRQVFGKVSSTANTPLPSGSAISTGPKSKSELTTDAGVIRLGEKSVLEAVPQGFALGPGITLLACAPDRIRRTMQVKTSGCKLKIRGTAQVMVDPHHSIKVVVLEGQVTIALDAGLGEFETIKAGQMLIINPDDRRLPEPVEIDVQRLVATSSLLNGGFGALATADKIKNVAISQALDFRRGDVAQTDLFLRPLDNAIEVQRVNLAFDKVSPPPDQSAAKIEKAIFENGINDLGSPGAIAPERDFLFPGVLTKTDTVEDTTFSRSDQNPGRAGTLDIRLAPHRQLVPGMPPKADRAPQIEGNVTADADFFSGSVKTLQFIAIDAAPGFDRVEIVPGANIFTPSHVGLTYDAHFGIDIDQATLTAGLGVAASDLLLISAPAAGVTVTGGSTLRGGKVNIQGGVNAANIVVDHSTVTAQQDLNIGLKTSPTGITVRNSSELQSVLANLSLVASRAPISLESNSKLASKKRLTVDAYVGEMTDSSGNPVTSPGVVSVRNAQLMAQAIRLRGYANGTDALLIDGSTLNAAELIKLYAEGASVLRFRNNVALNTKLAILAGQTVVVDAGGAVVISGKGRIYTDNADYNKSGFGTIQAGHGLITSPFGQRVDFQH